MSLSTRHFLLIAPLLAGCALFGSPSHVKNGELVETGNARYDAFFRQVHELQVSSTAWGDDHRESCKGLLDVLKLTPDAADVTIVQVTHERVGTFREVGAVRLDVNGENVRLIAQSPGRATEGARELFRNIEHCAHAEMLRAKTLRGIPQRADEIATTGQTLEPRIRDDFSNAGGGTRQNIKQEIDASVEVLATIAKNSQGEVRQAEDFVGALARAVGEGEQRREKGASGPATKTYAKPNLNPAPTASTSPWTIPASSGKPIPLSKLVGEKKPVVTKPPPPKPPADKPVDAPADKPKPKPKPTESGDVFNP